MKQNNKLSKMYKYNNYLFVFSILVQDFDKNKAMEVFANANNCLDGLPAKIRDYVEEKIKLCQPVNFHVCDGSEQENQQLLDAMEAAGVVRRLTKYKNW